MIALESTFDASLVAQCLVNDIPGCGGGRRASAGSMLVAPSAPYFDGSYSSEDRGPKEHLQARMHEKAICYPTIAVPVQWELPVQPVGLGLYPKAVGRSHLL